MARYSSVSGASRALAQRGAPVRCHWPFKSGYFDSSNARAPPIVMHSAAASATEPMMLRLTMTVPRCGWQNQCPSFGSSTSVCHSRWSLPRRIEISQIGRRLVLLGWHQMAIRAQEVVFIADVDMGIVLGANVFGPDRAFI